MIESLAKGQEEMLCVVVLQPLAFPSSIFLKPKALYDQDHSYFKVTQQPSYRKNEARKERVAFLPQICCFLEALKTLFALEQYFPPRLRPPPEEPPSFPKGLLAPQNHSKGSLLKGQNECLQSQIFQCSASLLLGKCSWSVVHWQCGARQFSHTQSGIEHWDDAEKRARGETLRLFFWGFHAS